MKYGNYEITGYLEHIIDSKGVPGGYLEGFLAGQPEFIKSIKADEQHMNDLVKYCMQKNFKTALYIDIEKYKDLFESFINGDYKLIIPLFNASLWKQMKFSKNYTPLESLRYIVNNYNLTMEEYKRLTEPSEFMKEIKDIFRTSGNTHNRGMLMTELLSRIGG
jgi:hypothetical protein